MKRPRNPIEPSPERPNDRIPVPQTFFPQDIMEPKDYWGPEYSYVETYMWFNLGCAGRKGYKVGKELRQSLLNLLNPQEESNKELKRLGLILHKRRNK